MLLTIHNLPSSTRYADVKSLLRDKCGLTDLIVDNLVNEGNSKKVTVGLANEVDGALVARKLNGIFINGQQLYIEHKKKNTEAHDQPYRAPANFVQESRGFEQSHISNIVAGAMAPNATAAWDPNAIAPYMAHMPVEQNLAYAGYGVPQAVYVEPIPIPVEQDRGYPGFQGNFAPVSTGSRPQGAGDWGNRGREPDSFQSSGPRAQAPGNWDKRGREPDTYHSGSRPQAQGNWDNRGREPEAFHSNETRPQAQGDWGNRGREPDSFQASGPRPQGPGNRADRGREPDSFQASGPRPQGPGNRGNRGREPDSFQASGPRPQAPGNRGNRVKPDDFHNNRQERERDDFRDRKRRRSPDRPEPRLSRKDGMNAGKKRREEGAAWPAENRGSRPPFHQPEKFSPQRQNDHDRFQPREPEYRHTDPQWEPKRWDEPPLAERDREWGNGNDERRDWETGRPAPKVWDNPPEQWADEPRPWDEPKPQWEDNYAPMPVEDHPPEWDYRQDPVGPGRSLSPPRDGRDRFHDSRSRRPDFDDRNSGPNWNRDRSGHRGVGRSSSRPNPVEETHRRDRPRSRNGRQERDWHDDRLNPSRDRPGPKKPDYGRANNYSKPQEERPPPGFRPKAIARPTSSQQDRNEKYKKPFETVPKKIPPKKPLERHLPLRVLINKDQSNRGQATALIAKTVKGIPKGANKYIPTSPVDAHVYKQLKVCIKSRIDVLLGEELSSDMSEIVKIYRTKFPITQDKSLLKQVTQKATKEHEEKVEQYRLEKLEKSQEIKKEPKDEVAVKKEPGTETENSQAGDVLNQAILEAPENKKDEATNAVKAPVAKAPVVKAPVAKAPEDPKKQTPVPLHPPNMPKPKKGKPLTDKQVIQQMKLQNKWEYDHDDLYSLNDVDEKALEEELTLLDNLFAEECSQPSDPQEGLICKRIGTDSLNDFHKTLRLYITKRFLNIQTGLAIRVFAQGKLPKKEAIKQYLKKYRVESMTLKKSVKGTMFMVNLSRFEDFDKLCKKGNDVIAGVPVSFKALHIIGPPPKITRKKVLALRQQAIKDQVDPNIDPTEFEDTELYGPIGTSADQEAVEDNGNIDDIEAEKDCEAENFEETEDFTADVGVDFGETEDFTEDINIGNINDDDLEDF